MAPVCFHHSSRIGHRPSERWLVEAADAVEPVLCGGKAAGLARLLRAGFEIPAGICFTTELYRTSLERTGVFAKIEALAAEATPHSPWLRQRLADIRRVIETASMGDEATESIRRRLTSFGDDRGQMLAVRSSAAQEDHRTASHAGIHATFIGDFDPDAVVDKVRACWASLWTEEAWAYRERLGIPHADAAMAVVVQRFVAGGRAGVAFSADPLTADPTAMVIEAAWGSDDAVVSGTRTPDRYRLTVKDGVATLAASELSAHQPVLSHVDVLELARLVQGVERTLGAPADVEWVFDGQTFWIVQGRPITAAATPGDATVWTRANLKEVFPDQPSPLALSYVSIALNRMFRSYHAAQGYELSPEARLVGVFRGRPYLNLTLMQRMAVARGGNPEIVSRLFGGAAAPPDTAPAPAHAPDAGLGHVARLARELLTTVFVTPRRAHKLFRSIRLQARIFGAVPIERLDDAALRAHLARFADTLLDEVALRRLHEIVSAQSRAYMILDRLLAAWLPSRAETLLTQLMTGLGTLPNAQLMYSLMRLSALARGEPRVGAFLSAAQEDDVLRRYRSALAGTEFLRQLDAVLREFGHRGRFESDVMSPRFAEDPEPLLRIIQLYLRAEALESPERHLARRRRVQRAAQAEVRTSLRTGQWLVFSIVCSALQRLLAQRDENRHVTTLLVTHLRRIVLEFGRRMVRQGRLTGRDDVFFLLWDEVPVVLAERDRDWRALVAERRRERARYRSVTAPDLLRGGEPAEHVDPTANELLGDDALVGLGVSPGTVTGTVKLLRTADDMRALSGEIVVLPAMEPSLTPLFPVVGGVIAELGGMLSHAAILAREYGLPAVVNVREATRRLQDGDRIELNGATGRIRLLRSRTDGGDGAVPVAKHERGDHQAHQRAGHDV